MDNDYIYKRLDDASLGHEADKAWVLDNVPQILDMIDRYDLNKQEVNGLQERIDDLEEQLWNEEANTARLEDEVAELIGEVSDLKRKLGDALDEVASLQHQVGTYQNAELAQDG